MARSMIRIELKKVKQNLLRGRPQSLLFSPEKVTELLPEQCANLLPDLEPTKSRRAKERLWFLAAKLFQ